MCFPRRATSSMRAARSERAKPCFVLVSASPGLSSCALTIVRPVNKPSQIADEHLYFG